MLQQDIYNTYRIIQMGFRKLKNLLILKFLIRPLYDVYTNSSFYYLLNQNFDWQFMHSYKRSDATFETEQKILRH